MYFHSAERGSARSWEFQLAELRLEIQMVRETVRNRPVDVHGGDELESEAPPSYTTRSVEISSGL